MRNEYRAIFTDKGVILVLILALLIYSTIYSFAYAPQVLRNVPIGVIDQDKTCLLYTSGVARDIPVAILDEDRTPLSRTVARMIEETPTALVAYDVQDIDEGERLMRQGKVMAIVQIPAFFEKNILSNSQTHIEAYITGTNITVNGLLAKDIQTAVTSFSAGIQIQLLTKQGLTQRQAMAQLMPCLLYTSGHRFRPERPEGTCRESGAANLSERPNSRTGNPEGAGIDRAPARRGLVPPVAGPQPGFRRRRGDPPHLPGR